jgi:hypothetical protein
VAGPGARVGCSSSCLAATACIVNNTPLGLRVVQDMTQSDVQALRLIGSVVGLNSEPKPA